MFETVFLSVLVVALALGNVFLSLLGPKRLRVLAGKKGEQEAEQGFGQSSVQDSFSEAAYLNGPSEVKAFAVRGQVSNGLKCKNSFDSEADKERIRHLGRRIDRLEQLLLKINSGDFLAQKVNATNFGQKLSDLEEFKQKTRLEIASLKQRLDDVKPVSEKKRQELPKLSDQRLHELVFRTR